MVNNHINYIELKAADLNKVKKFYEDTFLWKFTDYGPDYTAFSHSGLDGGFTKTDETIVNGALVVLYHQDLEAIRDKVLQNQATLSQDIFSFPGGRRFHFVDPAGNELAVWSDR